MSVYSTLILITNNSFAKAVVAPLGKVDGNDLFVTVNDLNQLKIMALLFTIGSLWTIIKGLYHWFTNKESNLDKRIDDIEKSQKEILTAIQRLDIHLAQVKDNKVTETQVRDIVRDEYEFIQKYRK